MIKISIIYHSGYGHTKRLAEAVLEGVMSVSDIEAKIISVDDIADNWDFVNASEAIIFGSPTYMGTISAPFKAFMDKTSKIWFKQEWKDKLAAGFTNSGWPSGDKLNTMMQINIFAAQHGMVWVNPAEIPGNLSKKEGCAEVNRLGSFLGVMSLSPFNEKADTAPPECDLQTARFLGERVSNCTIRWVNGKPA